MKWAINYTKKYKLKYILSNILLIIFDSSSIISPLLLGVIVDDGLKKGNHQLVWILSLFLIFFIIFRTLGSYFSVIELSKASTDIGMEIKKDVFYHLHEMDNNFYRKYNAGELMTVLTSDISMIRRTLINLIKKTSTMVITFLIGLIYCLLANPYLTFIILSPTIFICIISAEFLKKTKPLYKEIREDLSNLNNYIRDNIEGNRVVRAFSQEQEEINTMENKNNKYKNSMIKRNYMGIEAYNKIDFLSMIMVLFCVSFGGLFLMNGYITIGQFIVFNSMIYYLRSPFETLFDLLDAFQEFNTSKNRICNILSEEPIVKHLGTKEPKSLLCDIEFENVNVTLNSKNILNDINIKIKGESTIAFLGPIGSGKSTIVNLLLGFVEKTSGNITLGDIPLEDISIKWLRERIGYVSQQPFLFSDTISNNIKYGNLELSDEEMKDFSNRASLNFVSNLEDGYETIIGERGVGLSGGEKQRLALARALSVKPQLLILDDITSALDMETELLINKSIKNLNFPCTKIIIASKIVSVKEADIIYVIADHKVIEKGTHKELLKQKGYYYDIYKIQTGLKEGEKSVSK